MSSSIFYKFFHQKSQSTIHFDGTSINVFDLKHEIIIQNQLGQGQDFSLRLFHSEQPELEYENDQDIIPRSTFVLARRSPLTIQGGRYQSAARYVSGRPRIVKSKAPLVATSTVSSQPETVIDENLSEEDKIKLMLERQNDAWAKTQEELSTHKVVHGKPGTEDLPPPGYVCYRCGGKDHWIKNCPTNTDPTFEGKKIKRTTGIPRSYVKSLSKEAVEYRLANPEDNGNSIRTNENGDLVDEEGNTYQVTEAGDYVMTLADSKTWTLYQERQQSAESKARKEFEQNLVNQIRSDERFEFLNPLHGSSRVLSPPIVMTPCCVTKESLRKLENFNYNQNELEEALIERDFHCPNCNTAEIYLDKLLKNEELELDLKKYIENCGLEDGSGGKRKLDTAAISDLPPKRASIAK
ncbi:hypothetical protein FT663_05231 [Candidozyma haemuli var. vulneris]|uniref:DWNN domain-containing protein n=1 Tax=Candidozyma haemuli TaxID=45357 RepID=A0A2V1AUX9_9ASCO|nr:hypothetical protein CXQ85_000597 [[Candida] haemuloni]KAF3985566.1 hypothetical protein FT662_05081 [[Candida] haemuloni var. vulneris]KAF3985601.1 hypothetical protein FT663_05231 [[Candida] haemuloni var. vulneris]PVH21615.1 hypothetical protein CXQ85_000597 [[Candida] haemuloni]